MASLTRLISRCAIGEGRHRLRRAARSVAGQRTVVVPLLQRELTRHALDVACRLAADRGSRVLLIAPLFVENELPLDAHFKREEAALRAELAQERALAEGYGVGVRGEIVRARHGQLGAGVARAAEREHASLIVLGAAVESRRGFRHPFSRDVWSVLDRAPAPVMVVTGPPRRALAQAAA